jgi:acyl-coenzyme A synthetase/AMP-(fatty) acid ligase
MPTVTFQPEADSYYAQGYWRDGDLWSDFARRAEENPDKPALILDDRVFTFDQLRRAAVGISVRLADGGVQPGDVVILLGRHSIEAAVAMLGCMHRGVVIAPLPPMFNETQLSALLAQARATALLGFGGDKELAKCEQVADQVSLFFAIDADLVDRLAHDDPRAEHAPRHGDDLAMVLHSSGTTSTPKGIAHSNNTLRYATEGICRRWELTGEDIYLVVCEFGFVGGLVFGYFPPLFNGATGVLVNRWNAEDALRLIEEHGCTYVLSMPTHSADLIKAKQESSLDLPSMRVLAAPGLTRERRVAMQEAFGVPPLGDYGLSEVPGHAAHGLHESDAKIALTEGRPYDGTEIRIVDDKERPVAPNTVGSVIVPAEVEPVILRHPHVREVAIVPLPDERLGERACAAIIAVEGKVAPTLEELQQFLDEQGVAKYTWPESVEAFEDFPRTPSLKVVKRDVVTRILERSEVTA